MRVSEICFGKLKEFEGLRTEAYYDAAGVLTIGYGHTGHDVRPGDVISKYWAEHLLKADLYDVEKAVESLGVARTQGQFDLCKISCLKKCLCTSKIKSNNSFILYKVFLCKSDSFGIIFLVIVSTHKTQNKICMQL